MSRAALQLLRSLLQPFFLCLCFFFFTARAGRSNGPYTDSFLLLDYFQGGAGGAGPGGGEGGGEGGQPGRGGGGGSPDPNIYGLK